VPNLSAFQGGLSEDEALQRALQQSLQGTAGKNVIEKSFFCRPIILQPIIFYSRSDCSVPRRAR